MNRVRFGAVRLVVLSFGIWCGVAGIEHGFFEVLQGNVVPEYHMVAGRPMIYAIGDSMRFWQFGYEYAYTVVPNFLVTGILAMIAGLSVVVVSVGVVHRKFGWLLFILLSVLQYLVGGGAAQVTAAVLTGLLALLITRSPKVLQAIPAVVRRVLGAPWLVLVIALLFVSCHSIVTAVFGWFYGLNDPDLISQVQWGTLYVLAVLFFATVVSAIAHDSLHEATARTS